MSRAISGRACVLAHRALKLCWSHHAARLPNSRSTSRTRMATLGRLLFRRSVLRLIPPADAKVSERKSSSFRSTSDADAYRSSRDFLRHRRIIRSRSDGTSLTISRSGFGSSRVTAVIIETSRLSLERPPAREPLVEHRAKCKYVTAGISLIACQLFGGHVLYCAYDRARASEGHGRGLFIGRHLLKFGETEVEQLRSGLREHDVCGFEVTMDDAVAVCG